MERRKKGAGREGKGREVKNTGPIILTAEAEQPRQKGTNTQYGQSGFKVRTVRFCADVSCTATLNI